MLSTHVGTINNTPPLLYQVTRIPGTLSLSLGKAEGELIQKEK
jgi:hypothetical protein